jgi:ribosomal protein S20
MSVSSVSSGVSSSSPFQVSSLWRQRRQDLKTMESAVQAGDLTSAQQALAAFQQDQQALQSARSAAGAQGQGFQSQNQFQTDLAAFTTAIQSGDLQSAQTALSTLEQDRRVHAGGPSGQGQGAFKTDLQTLLQAVQSGV